MKPLRVCLMAALIVTGIVVAGCSPAAPSAPAPSPVPAPTKASGPTDSAPRSALAPTAQPTSQPPVAAPSFPEKGKTITIIVPQSAGGSSDAVSRLIGAGLETELGVSVVVVNKPGAIGQIGMTELAQSKPDGYTMAHTSLQSTILTYLDPRRKAIYSRKDFEPLALHEVEPGAIAARADSSYKTFKDLLDAAKAKPGQIKAGTTGLGGNSHLFLLGTEKETGVKFAQVNFESGVPASTALLGGNVDVVIDFANTFRASFKSGGVRLLGVAAKEENKFYPGVPTFESQGYRLYYSSSRGFSLPAATPKGAVSVLSQAIQKIMASADYKKKMDDLSANLRYMDPEQFSSYWRETEDAVRPFLDDLIAAG